MWYFAWILGILLACSLGIINGLWLEQVEANELADEENKNNLKE
ncbi:cytochrome bd-I oxidase subunit CydX [Psychromonas sp. RZ22]|nr:cytochrome bd-I oxidase subunit CydX [Psychromonas sp. RZ22]TEW53421.1 cytochrome bd-I oxidase subunit CydX [Psychromonas sp. RZ22]